MSLFSRREYLRVMRKRYRMATTRQEKGRILSEVEATCGYHRKYAIRVLADVHESLPPRRRRSRKRQYIEALPIIQVVWEALDYPCAERLHPVLLQTAEQLEAHGELRLSPPVREQLAQISRATLARRLATLPSPKPRRLVAPPKPGIIRQTAVPIGRYPWDEAKPGALEIDLVEHNGGNSSGHFAYTLSVVDVVTYWSRRKAVLGRGQRGVHQALSELLQEWPYPIWGLHSDNGTEFLNDMIVRFAQGLGLKFSRSRPYKKNDNPHVEQRNRQFVRDIVGYERYDTPEQVEWLNHVYAVLDPYANLFLPTRKVIAKERNGVRVRKKYDTAKTPYSRAIEAAVLSNDTKREFDDWLKRNSPLALHRQLEKLLDQGAPPSRQLADAAD
jgi:hypothetical protein